MLLAFTGCTIEEVSKNEKDTITIVSDYLQPSDTVLFALIQDSLGITINIKQMSTDQLIGEIRNKRFDTGIDVVMMESAFDVNRLRRMNIFHPITTSELRNRWRDHNVIPIAINRYIRIAKFDSLSNDKDSPVKPHSYHLSKDELVVYLSFDFDYSDPVLATANIKRAKERHTTVKSDIWQCDELVVPKRYQEVASKDSLFQNFNWSDPITTTKYNVLTIGIVNQPPNFNQTIRFIRLLRSDNYLKPLIEKFRLSEIPVRSGSLKLDLEDQIQYFVRIEKLLR